MEAPNLYFISFDDNGLARHVWNKRKREWVGKEEARMEGIKGEV